jgi:aldose 1-epimerase
LSEPARNNHIHGFLYDKKWELCGAKYEGGKVVVETLFDSDKEPDVKRQFPHSFTVKMTFELEGASLTQTATVTNKGESPFPWGIGYHTTFNFPFVPGDALADCRFSLTAAKQWELNKRLLPTGQLLDIPDSAALNGEGIDLTGRPLDDAFLSSIAAGEEGNEAVLTDRTSGIAVTYRGDANFKHWVIYNGDSRQGFLCPEPYTWITNAPNLELDPKITGVLELNPGEEKSVACTTAVSGLSN